MTLTSYRLCSIWLPIVTKTASTTLSTSSLPNFLKSSSLKLLWIHSTSPSSILFLRTWWKLAFAGAIIFGLAPTSMLFVHLVLAIEFDPTMRWTCFDESWAMSNGIYMEIFAWPCGAWIIQTTNDVCYETSPMLYLPIFKQMSSRVKKCRNHSNETKNLVLDIASQADIVFVWQSTAAKSIFQASWIIAMERSK